MRKLVLVNSLILFISAVTVASPSATSSAPVSIEQTLSVFGSFSKLDNKCIRDIWDELPPRNTASDLMVANLVEKRLPEFGPGLIILDSGHAHSIAASVRLAELGYAVQFKMEHDKNYSTTSQAAAAAKYYTARLRQAKRSPHYGAKGLVIALDTHRLRAFQKQEFPSASEVMSRYSGRVIWVTETAGAEAQDIPLLYRNHPQIHIARLVANPYANNTPADSVRVPLSVESAACSQWDGWNIRFL